MMLVFAMLYKNKQQFLALVKRNGEMEQKYSFLNNPNKQLSNKCGKCLENLILMNRTVPITVHSEEMRCDFNIRLL